MNMENIIFIDCEFFCYLLS